VTHESEAGVLEETLEETSEEADAKEEDILAG
jgi:hypothetical protein